MMIYCICLNTAVGARIVIPRFELGAVVRSESFNEMAAGKGVNVARTVSCLGGEACLRCFSGPLDIDLFSSDVGRNVTAKVTAAVGQTRRNVTVLLSSGAMVCHIQNPGYTVPETDFRAFQKDLFTAMKPADLVALSGSTPPGLSPVHINGFIQAAREKGATVLVDTDARTLASIDSGAAALAKPNLDELSQLAGRALIGTTEIVAAALKHLKSRTVVVSMADKGALWIDQQSSSFWQGMLAESPDAAPKDGVGSGDAMLGAIALGMAQQKAPRDLLVMGMAAGYANLFADRPGAIDHDIYDRALETAQVKKIAIDPKPAWD